MVLRPAVPRSAICRANDAPREGKRCDLPEREPRHAIHARYNGYRTARDEFLNPSGTYQGNHGPLTSISVLACRMNVAQRCFQKSCRPDGSVSTSCNAEGFQPVAISLYPTLRKVPSGPILWIRPAGSRSYWLPTQNSGSVLSEGALPRCAAGRSDDAGSPGEAPL